MKKIYYKKFKLYINNWYPLYFYKQLLKLKEFLEENELYFQLIENYKKFITNVCILSEKNNKEKIFLYMKKKINSKQ